ncbi:MAG TPA: ATP-binding protein [Candidatus Limnocylindrales bacterium]|nr:ATP-binding protein [Candidatus Limnocylindrales bacterium]
MDPAVVIATILAVTTIVAAVAWARRGRTLDRATSIIQRLRDEAAARSRTLAERDADDGALLDALDEGVIRIDAANRVTQADRRAHLLLGQEPGALPGRSLMEAFMDPAVEGLVTRTRQGSTGPATVELRPTGADGTVVTVRARPTASDDSLWLILEDVSELRRLQRIRTEFIDNLSHELRTPLTTVSLLSETLQREAEAVGDAIPVKMRDRIAKIEIETGHLVQMVNELLDLSRIESGGTLQMSDDVDMSRLAADSAERLRLFGERQGVTLRFETPPGLPHVRGDSARLGQVVVNLVHNAVKFSPDGGEITIRTTAHEGRVVTSVEDHGIGIPRAARDRVFERFYKVDRARLRAEAGGGTGLGLAIARHVVEQHGGRIWVESREGAGSTFAFALPAADGSPGVAR